MVEQMCTAVHKTRETGTESMARMEESSEINREQQGKVVSKAREMEDKRKEVKEKMANTLFREHKSYTFH